MRMEKSGKIEGNWKIEKKVENTGERKIERWKIKGKVENKGEGKIEREGN